MQSKLMHRYEYCVSSFNYYTTRQLLHGLCFIKCLLPLGYVTILDHLVKLLQPLNTL